MTFSKTEYFECNNPSCRLRFPVYDEEQKPRRCPACRSDLHLASTTENRYEDATEQRGVLDWQVEVLLDNIRSAWNVGAILRTSDGMGIRKAYYCGITPRPDQTKVAKTALGAEYSIPWESHNNSVILAGNLKAAGHFLWALEDIPGASSIYSEDVTVTGREIVLVVGNENCGVDPAVLEQCDRVFSIPMLGRKQSYNVAVAYGMAVSFLLYRHSVSQGSLRIFPST